VGDELLIRLSHSMESRFTVKVNAGSEIGGDEFIAIMVDWKTV